jgi:hypothetical protein
MRAFLAQHHRAPALAGAVAPNRTPACPTADIPAVPASIDEADALVSRLEPDGKRMPVLLRQYLKLNARVISFSVDPAFGNTVDALMAADLTTVNPQILARYFGSDAATRLTSADCSAPLNRAA